MLKTPPLLIGAALLFWGWQTDFWFLGAAGALLVEGSRLVKAKWDLKPGDFNRLADLGTIIFLIFLVYFLFTRKTTTFFFNIVQWLPLTFLPILLGQMYSTSQGIAINALFLTKRKKKKGAPADDVSRFINLTYPYFAVCLLAASAANQRTPWFYAGLLLLCAWALWPFRPKQYPVFLWVILLIGIGLAGFGTQTGLHNLQLFLEDKAVGWLIESGHKEADPFRAWTAIGDIGKIKLSDRILFRVEGLPGPLLLQEAAYDLYQSSSWFAQRSLFRIVNPEADPGRWKLDPQLEKGRSALIHLPLKKGNGLLKLPAGTYTVKGPPGLMVQRNQLGAVKVMEGPGLLHYAVEFDQTAFRENPPGPNDLVVPSEELAGITPILEEFRLKGQPPQEVPGLIKRLFREKFTYSLTLAGGAEAGTPLRGEQGSPLNDFLLKTRSGHCEYFATAAVLLLRSAGIPARYAAGYMVDEFSPREKKFLVREKHAHAWALAWLDGSWQEVDATPPSWLEAQRASRTASLIRLATDLWSWAMFKLSSWREQEDGASGAWTKYLLWLLAVPTLYLMKRLRKRSRKSKEREQEKTKTDARLKPGSASPFYRIEKHLQDRGYARKPGETATDWLKRIEEPALSPSACEWLRPILALHYRYRFDRPGLNPEERLLLDHAVHAWLTEQAGEVNGANRQERLPPARLAQNHAKTHTTPSSGSEG